MSFAILETTPDGVTRLIATEPTLKGAIVDALSDDAIDTVDLLELERVDVPEARQKALASEARTRPVRLAVKDDAHATHTIQVGAIQREFSRAVVETGAKGEMG